MGRSREYSSTQVDLTETLSREVIAWGIGNIRDRDLHPDDLCDGREMEPHITILQGLIDADPQKVRFLIRNESPLVIHLGNTRVFRNDGFDVVVIDVECPALYSMNQLLAGRFDSCNLFPVYIPHVTVAYVRKDSVQPGDDTFVGRTFVTRHIVFSDPKMNKSIIKLRGRLDPA